MFSVFLLIAASLAAYPNDLQYSVPFWHVYVGIDTHLGKSLNYELDVPNNIGSKCYTITTGVSVRIENTQLSIFDNANCDGYRKTYMDANEYYKQCGICNGFGIAGSGYPANMLIPFDNPIMGKFVVDTSNANCPAGNYIPSYILSTQTELGFSYILGGVNNVYNFGFRINQTDKNHIKGEWLDKLPTDSTAKVLFSIENNKCTLVKNHWVKIQLDTFEVANCKIVTQAEKPVDPPVAPVDPSNPSEPTEPEKPVNSEESTENSEIANLDGAYSVAIFVVIGFLVLLI
ncbi:hypothetical protein EIN_383710 [Entamoeba invadens IP1]|uniref:Uncharacterized protein n=1 Tax=Entamoeba invadens IP1 TaxID=370355 RepID=A0A0A1U0Y9_ENTIV|nr:hypothetical protein EIN_383710 [Entamoeba invadens IP1]ELP87697.1 hypothetical protein EIN_383710 [Entamoeba invadens IP1]|eukprot:XP_004254468.1 hypothetical protein EIN_383710 [Entamoeba invadens IP1]